MVRLLHRLNLSAICLLGAVLAVVLAVQVRPGVRALAEAGSPEDQAWLWPKTLQVYPSGPDDPVKLVKITKAGEDVVPGKYQMPQVAGDISETNAAVTAWLSDVSFTLRSNTHRKVVSVGMAYVFQVRRTGSDCYAISNFETNRWCDAHPHWCDGGCPMITHYSLHWGLVPAVAATGLKSRYRAESNGRYGDRSVLEGKDVLLLGSGQEINLSADGRVDGMVSSSDPRGGIFTGVLNGILFQEGMEEARGERPCAERASSKTGCAFSKVPKFNFGIDMVYFEDGTFWGNYGYGYATPNSDGIFTRVGPRNMSDPILPGHPPR